MLGIITATLAVVSTVVFSGVFVLALVRQRKIDQLHHAVTGEIDRLTTHSMAILELAARVTQIPAEEHHAIPRSITAPTITMPNVTPPELAPPESPLDSYYLQIERYKAVLECFRARVALSKTAAPSDLSSQRTIH